MHTKEADLTGLRAIGARVFVKRETYTRKLDDRSFEGKLCGFSQDNKAYRIFNPSKGTVVESRNVTFIETPPYTLPEDYGYEGDTLHFTSAMEGPRTAEDTFDSTRDQTFSTNERVELQPLRQDVRTLRHNNQVR